MQNSSYALAVPTASSSLLYRLWYKAQILKYAGNYDEANKIFNLVFQEIIKNPEIPHEVFWEMGNLYKGDPTQEEMNGILSWATTLTRAGVFGPNKSIISVNITTDNRVCYFCIPLPLLDKKTALYALEKATPVPPVVHKRNENSLAAMIQNKLTSNPMNMIFGDAEMLVC
jgi:hypothetical protein